MFDLTGFRISQDTERVYFELKYGDLVEFGKNSEWGFDGTYTRIAVDCRGGGTSNFGRDAGAALEGSCDYLINVSDYGVLVWGDGRVVGVLKLNTSGNRLGDADSNSIDFSIPQSVIGKPQSEWRYAVAVGGSCYGGRHLRDGVGVFLEVGETPTDTTGGGGLDGKINPNIYDVLLPPGMDQKQILGAWDPITGKQVLIPMIGN
jgi:hypothetical protein